MDLSDSHAFCGIMKNGRQRRRQKTRRFARRVVGYERVLRSAVWACAMTIAIILTVYHMTVGVGISAGGGSETQARRSTVSSSRGVAATWLRGAAAVRAADRHRRHGVSVFSGTSKWTRWCLLTAAAAISGHLAGNRKHHDDYNSRAGCKALRRLRRVA